MADMKVKSFRIDDVTANKFKEVSVLIGGNQQETMSELIRAYELQQSKTALPEKTEQIETMQRYANSMVAIYMQSLEDGATLKETIHEEYASLLRAKDGAISSLQGLIEEDKIKLSEMKKAQEEVIKLQKEVAEKDKMISLLNQKISDLQAQQKSVEMVDTLQELVASFFAKQNSAEITTHGEDVK